MALRNMRTGARQLYSGEQRVLLEKLLDVIENYPRQNVPEVMEVLTVMLATMVTTHAVSRYAAENAMARVVMKMDEIIAREPWPEEQIDIQRH